MSQDQFLEVIDRDEAERRFRAAVDFRPLGPEEVPLEAALGRVLAADVVAQVDVPAFDRSNFDGYAVRAADTYGAQEESPRTLKLLGEVLAAGVVPQQEVTSGTATTIATGGMLPRGADAIAMVEHCEEDGETLLVYKAVVPGFGVSFAGTDIARGEIVLRNGTVLGSRETGVLAAIGANKVTVWRRPRVAIFSTGDELLEPGQPIRPAMVYDSNSRILADAVRELGGEAVEGGIVADDVDALRQKVHEAMQNCDLVLLSGGTSKGAGDLSYRVASELREPGIVAHGVALKPGKPLCLAAHRGKALVVLPGSPTSAIFTFHEFVAPLLHALGGRSAAKRSNLQARLAVKVLSEIGRTEYLLVGLVQGPELPAAYPMGKGSSSVTAFSRADGFVTIDRHEEIVEAGTIVNVQQISGGFRMADLVVIGSHCAGLDFLLKRLHEQGFHTKYLSVGSEGGLHAVKRGECDVAGMHLFDPKTGLYNRPYLTPELTLVPGYRRRQGLVFRPGDPRFEGRTTTEALRHALADPDCIMVNRNQGSGTRALIDRLLQGAEPPGYAVQPTTHNAVAAAVAQRRADWGIAIEWTAGVYGLKFLPVEDEHYDFVVPNDRLDRPAVKAFLALIADPKVRQDLSAMGFLMDEADASTSSSDQRL